jgi:hypothetical protein
LKPLSLDPKRLQQLERLLPLLVFAIALGVRLFYDLVISEHRLCSFGDGYFFIKTGQEFAKAITSAASFPDFLAKLTVHTSEVAGGVATFGSGALADRLLLDGPIYTFFLAVVSIITGVVGTSDYAQNSNIFAIANSLVDAFSCVLIYWCGRLAFNSKAGLVAALLFAVYPAATLNTRLCYSELFTYFLLLGWTALSLSLFRLKDAERPTLKLAVSFFLGAISIVLVLARSVFSPLPILSLGILFVPNLFKPSLKEYLNFPAVFQAFLAMIIGGALFMAPWLWFTHEVTGKFVPWVNRAPGYNLFVGNQLNTDGWRTWPAQPGIPNETSEAVKSLRENFSSDPCRFSSLLLRKESRLWAGVWNDFQHKFYGLSWHVQNVFHDLLLLFAFTGFIAAVGKSGTGIRRPALVLALIAAFHGVYACFEPVARYGITAMPFVSLLAGYAVSVIRSPFRNRWFLFLILFASWFFSILDSHFSFIPLIFSIFPSGDFVPAAWLDASLWLSLWLFLGSLVCKLCAPINRWQNAILWFSIASMALINGSSLIYDPARMEWCTELEMPSAKVEAEIAVPKLPERSSSVSYVLVDLQTELSSPVVTALVNGTVAAPPLPVLQLMNRQDAAEIFPLQAQAMGVDPRSFRHWWAFPIPTNVISDSKANRISIAMNKPETETIVSNVKIFGEYPTERTTQKSYLKPEHQSFPSINKFSWVKGFVTIDRRDVRPYETLSLAHAIDKCTFKAGETASGADLSSALGRQFGSYRMLLYIPPLESSPKSSTAAMVDHTTLFQLKEERVVSGGDPSTMLLNAAPIKVPRSDDSAFYTLSCDFKAGKSRSIGGISLSLSNHGGGTSETLSKSKRADSWASPWSPTSLTLPSGNNEWHHFSFTSRIPTEISQQSNTTAAIMVSPFPADRLFQHRKGALRDTVKVRDVELRYFPCIAPEISDVKSERLF